uniref:Uncharacterized protein n=1 Tax=viral metagenome TaxID=1070528 RepID=A0A6H2A2L7_9ZZZZ
MRRLRVLSAYTARARFLAECEERPAGWIVAPPRDAIPSPYFSSLTRLVWKHDSGTLVIVSETQHRRFEVWSVEGSTVYATERAAEQAAFNTTRREFVKDNDDEGGDV